MKNNIKNNSLNILYEDNHIIVCAKPHGVPVQSKNTFAPDMVSMLKTHIYDLAPQNGEPFLGVIHRLDQPVEGILVFAKSPFAARELNRQLQSHGFGKYYRALVDGTPDKEEDTLENYMIKDGRTNTSRICSPDTPGAKLARLHYEIVKQGQGENGWGRGKLRFPPSPTAPAEAPSQIQTELEIQLDTGRHHQIRVQLANIGCPIVGDTKYNPNASNANAAEWQEIRLCAYRLTFRHPKTGEEMTFSLL